MLLFRVDVCDVLYSLFANKNYDNFVVTKEEAQRYYKEIQEDTFLPSTIVIKLGIEGKYSTDRNVNFIRKIKKYGWKATPGDVFFLERTKFYKLEFRGNKIKKKEVCLNQEETKLLWYNEGKNRSHSIKVADIIDVELGITETFLRYCSVSEFQELIKDDTLCLSIKTNKRSVDFYGYNSKDVQTWYDRLKGIAEANMEEKIQNFSKENKEPSLLELNFDKVKEVVWEEKVIPKWQKYFDCLAFPLVPINYKDIKISYQVPVASKSSKEEEKAKEQKMKVVNRYVSFTDLILAGIPCKIRAIIYPVIIPNEQNITSNYFEILEEEYNQTGKISKQLRYKYETLVDEAICNYKDALNKSGFEYEDIKGAYKIN